VRDFYAALTVPGGRTVLDVRRAAVALNHATLRLRERYPDWPTFWAGHIHTGP
jgi:CHAT domain-containing protein